MPSSTGSTGRMDPVCCGDRPTVQVPHGSYPGGIWRPWWWRMLQEQTTTRTFFKSSNKKKSTLRLYSLPSLQQVETARVGSHLSASWRPLPRATGRVHLEVKPAIPAGADVFLEIGGVRVPLKGAENDWEADLSDAGEDANGTIVRLVAEVPGERHPWSDVRWLDRLSELREVLTGTDFRATVGECCALSPMPRTSGWLKSWGVLAWPS